MLGAKLHAPAVQKNTVSREALITKLNRIREYRLTTVVAPAGYGKTTAVLDWMNRCALPTAWLSIDTCDNNPARFWRYACAALEEIAPGVGREAEYVFSSAELIEANIHINILINRIAGSGAECLLVLDDVHLVSNPAIQKGISFLAEYLPQNAHMVLISRTEPPLRLSRQRMAGNIYSLNEKDLRFEVDEIAAFYRMRGYLLGSREIKEVESYTEGWAAALEAVAMSMGRGNKNFAIAALAHASRDIGQYIRDEVIGSWPEEKLNFAMQTAILDTLTEPLCDAVTCMHNAPRMLAEISAESGFLTLTDVHKQEYRYHNLFTVLLKELLEKNAPEIIPQLHQRAAKYLESCGQISLSIEHLLRGGAYAEAFQKIERCTYHLIQKNQYDLPISWLNRLPEDLREKSIQAALIYTMYHADTGRLDLARQWFSKVKERAALANDNNPDYTRFIQTACMLTEANLFLREGDIDSLTELIAKAAKDGAGHFVMPEYFDFNTSDIYFYRSPIAKLSQLYERNPEQFEKTSGQYRTLISVYPGYKPLAAGEYLYEHNRMDEAVPFLLEALEEAQTAGCAGVLAPVAANLARIKCAKGDIRGAMTIAQQCEKKLETLGKPHWQDQIRAFYRLLSLRAGMVPDEEWLRDAEIYTEITRIREFEYIVTARALMAAGRTDDAAILLRRILAFTERMGRHHSQAEVLLLLSILAYRTNDSTGALSYLGRSLAIGLEEGYIRAYLDEPVAYLLKRFAISRRSGAGITAELKAFARSLLKQMHENFPQSLSAHSVHDAGLEKLLTAQEKKVLRLLMEAYSNEEISAKLNIGLRTVKTHTANIYSKFGVKNRVQCMKLVREEGLGSDKK